VRGVLLYSQEGSHPFLFFSQMRYNPSVISVSR